MALTATKKLEQLHQKLSSLKQEQEKIQEELTQDLLRTLRPTQAFTLDFPTLIGGILNVIQQIQLGCAEREGWQQAGKKFLKGLPKHQPQKAASFPKEAA